MPSRSALAGPGTHRRPPARVRPGLYGRRAAFAGSGRALVVAFCWGVAEAIAFPIVPDLGVAFLALAAPRRFGVLALAATAGSVTGSAAAYGLGSMGATGAVAHMPLVTDRMVAAAAGWMQHGGAWGVWHQPWSGVPIKVFGFQASGQGVPLVPFLGATLLARGHRILAIAAAFASVGALTRRWLPRWYGPLVLVLTGLFTVGLIRTLQSWS